VLDCPFYARDELGGQTRAFTPCFGEVMHGDAKLPYTCGSQARRSLIKYFYRNHSTMLGRNTLRRNVSDLFQTAVNALLANYTDVRSLGCMDAATGTCRLEACAEMTNGFAPCLATDYALSGDAVARSLLLDVLHELQAYYDESLRSMVPWTAYYTDKTRPQPPMQWAKTPAMATAAASLSQFDTGLEPIVSYSAQEAFALPIQPAVTPIEDALHSQWGVCAAKVGQVAMTLPIDPLTERPHGAEWWSTQRAADHLSWEALEFMIQNITRHAMASGCPFVWHRDRRHAPSPSRMCRSTVPETKTPQRMRVVGTRLRTPQGTLVVQADAVEHFPLYGFESQSIGHANASCVCATAMDEVNCVLSVETCASVLASIAHTNATTEMESGTTSCDGLRDACQTPSRTYDVRQQGPAVRRCLRLHPSAAAVRCPELGPSDLWGLFPAGSTLEEGQRAGDWLGGTDNVPFESARLLHEPRGGLRLSNYRSVNATFHTQGITYASHTGGASDAYAIPHCFAASELMPDTGQEDVTDWARDALLAQLFPAAQLVGESPATSVCTRYVIETARARVLRGTSSERNAALQAAHWRRRCGAQVRELAACSATGVLFDVAPPAVVLVPEAQRRWCGLSLALTSNDAEGWVYLTPQGCVAVDRRTQRMYDAKLCAYLRGKAEQGTLDPATDLRDDCALRPQPMALLRGGEASYAMLFTEGGAPLSADWLVNFEPPSLDAVRAPLSATRDPVSHVLDWWPDTLPSPVGFHVTASAMDPTEFAPMLFDSHYVFDPVKGVAFYVHSAARNASLLYDLVGAGGLCRATNVAAPLLDANTNRVCTRMSRQQDTPTLPVETPRTGGGAEEAWPYSKAYMDRYFGPEHCGRSHDDVPWSNGTDAQSAGDLPGWRTHFAIDAMGETVYEHAVFPPPEFEFVDLLDVGEWSDACHVVWGGTRTCDWQRISTLTNARTGCFEPSSVCLPWRKDATNGTGLCISARTALNDADGGRSTCFATWHCPSGQVCLADGACAPLHLHVWNPSSHTWNMEVTVLADQCGFRDPSHPFTQSMRGATPWETVPDLMHMHGLCGHKAWFAYRTAIWDAMCPIVNEEPAPGSEHIGSVGGEQAYMTCANASQVAWPWIHERFDRERATQKPFQTLEEGRALRAWPHACDQAFMHLQNPWRPGHRLEVCSGEQGQAYRHLQTYALADGAPGPTAGAAHWLRTYDEGTDTLHVGVLNNRITADVRLGFLGADLVAEDVRSDMAEGNVEFKRCVDFMGCEDPSFTFNGVVLERRNPATLANDLSELSLRLCGSIGYLEGNLTSAEVEGHGGVCWLDTAMFPLLAHLLWSEEAKSDAAQKEGGCAALFSNVNDWVQRGEGLDTPDMQVQIRSSPSALFCEGTVPEGRPLGRCAFAARTSSRLTDAQVSDAVARLTDRLNDMLREAGDAVARAYGYAGSATRTYERINRCFAQLMDWTQVHRSALQEAYATVGAGGLYLGLRLVLFEVPIAWLHHAMLVTLLSLVDPSVPAPNLKALGRDSTLSVFLWGKEERDAVCVDGLTARPVLWHFLCTGEHPEYTFKAITADQIAEAIRTETQRAIQMHMPTLSNQVRVTCRTGIAWNCGGIVDSPYERARCWDALFMAYNTTANAQPALFGGDGDLTPCQAALADPQLADNAAADGIVWLDPCTHPEHFEGVGDTVTPTLAELNEMANTDGRLTRYVEELQQMALRLSAGVAMPIDYIGTKTWEDLFPVGEVIVGQPLPIVRVWPLSDLLFNESHVSPDAFDLNRWIRTEVCQRTLADPAAAICGSQYATDPTRDACLERLEYAEADLHRYYYNDHRRARPDETVPPPEVNRQDEPSVIIRYAPDSGEPPTVIPLCTKDASLLLRKETGVCFVQHRGRVLDVGGTDDAMQQLRSCDIEEVIAPPGVEIQGFALRMTQGQWIEALEAANAPADGEGADAWPDNFCTASNAVTDDGTATFGNDRIRPCTWTQTETGQDIDDASWWSGNVSLRAGPRPDLDGFQPLAARFDEMGNWWKDMQRWKSNGCQDDAGLCSVRIRLNRAGSTTGAGQCGATIESNTQSARVNCDGSAYRQNARAFLVAAGPSSTLYKCGPCTRYRKRLATPPGLRFQCALPENSVHGANLIAGIRTATAFLRSSPRVPDGLNVSSTKTFLNGTALDVEESFMVWPWAHSLSSWGQKTTATDAPCDPMTNPSNCFSGMNTLNWFLADDLKAWTRAVANPTVRFTMLCANRQRYLPEDAVKCNAPTDRVRKTLGEFVDRQYRRGNGVWLPTVPRGNGLAWVSSVATARMFSLMYASTERPERDVQTEWLMGNGPCSDASATIQNRVCVRSTLFSTRPFQPLHPWVGGDFNPFDGYDQCGSGLSSGVQGTLCPCMCAPEAVCAGGSHNYSEAQREREFPTGKCNDQPYASTPIMPPNDPSNLCEWARAMPRAARTAPQCTHPQGLFGDASASQTVSFEQLHARGGVGTQPAEFLIQDMYGADGQGNGLWTGRTLQQEQRTGNERYAFLRLDPEQMHPAHIAFSTADATHTGAPLLMMGVALRADRTPGNNAWIATLEEAIRADAAWLPRLYPQLLRLEDGARSDDWTCPLRVMAFWGGTREDFAPVVPSPPLAQMLYGRGGAHPLIRSRRARDMLRPYRTTNGACFYLTPYSGQDAVGVLTDATHPCGLHGLLRLLQSGDYAPSLVMNVPSGISNRPPSLLDTPDFYATLRSGETLVVDDDDAAPVGALPRLSPFLMRIRADGGRVAVSSTLTTRSEGGDCHMGRALLAPESRTLAGRACALVTKNATAAVARCPRSSSATPLDLAFGRARATTLAVLRAKTRRMYRSQVRTDLFPFWGPGGGPIRAESSVGLLFASSLIRVLAHDLRRAVNASRLDARRWQGADAFWSQFLNGSLWHDNEAEVKPDALAEAVALDARVWSKEWAWHSATPNQTNASSPTRSHWRSNRFDACNRSFYARDVSSNTELRPLSLCEPAPTASLQSLCTAMLRYRRDVQNVNCELMGGGACLYQPGAFYVPYAWSPSNQKFVADTVNGYYKEILTQPRFVNVDGSSPSFAQLCPERGGYAQALADLSRAQAKQCPGHHMESVKNLLLQIKLVTYDVLYMAYALLMFGINAIGSVLVAGDAFSASTMLEMAAHYLGRFIKVAEKAIMPILNACITVLFGTSTFGQVMQTVLSILCQAYNIVVNDVMLPIWCGVVRPALYGIFEALRAVTRVFSNKAADDIRDVWIAISGSDGGPDPATCLGSLVAKIDCDAGRYRADDNQSNYLAAAVATRCWVDNSGGSASFGGGGPLGGATDTGFLACTGSDTCAQDPLHLDATTDKPLLACAACPNVEYACNTLLKRCTCGASARAPDACMTSSDCMRSGPECAIVSDLNDVLMATSHLPCNECGAFGMQPACVRLSATAAGTCVCAAVAATGTFQQCAARGRTVSLLQATGFCLGTVDLTLNLLSPSLVLDFGALVIVSCVRGLSANGCVGVELPLASGGRYPVSLVVIILEPSAAGLNTNRRRLLVADEDAPWHRRCAAQPTRAQAKECAHWALAVAQVADDEAVLAAHHNWTVMRLLLAGPTRHNQSTRLRMARRLLTYADENHGLVPRLLETVLRGAEEAMDAAVGVVTVPRGRRLFQQKQPSPASSSYQSPIEWPLSYVVIGSQCTVLDDAFARIASAWSDTLTFYANGPFNASPDTPTYLEATLDATFNASGTTVAPAPAAASGVLGDIANALTGGYGRALLYTFVQPTLGNESETRLNGDAMLSELAYCNFTALTLGTRSSVNPARGMTLLYVGTLTALLCVLLTTCVLPAGLLTRFVWYVLFPMTLLWMAYGVSPRCWPMIPPRIAHDLATEIAALLPLNGWEVPSLLVREDCNVRGFLLEEPTTFDPQCFRTCDIEPFLFKSWQDTGAWWLCDFSSKLCLSVADTAGGWPFLGDFVSSATYFAEVVQFSVHEPDFTAAFRTCAAFTLFHLVFSVAVALFVLVALPSVLMALLDTLAITLVLLSQASANEGVVAASTD
jgi:hypothetical protein